MGETGVAEGRGEGGCDGDEDEREEDGARGEDWGVISLLGGGEKEVEVAG